MPVNRMSYSFVCVPVEDPKVPASVIEVARAAVRDGVAETCCLNYSNVHYKLDKVPSVSSYDVWAIHRLPAAPLQRRHRHNPWDFEPWGAGGAVHTGEVTVVPLSERPTPVPAVEQVDE